MLLEVDNVAMHSTHNLWRIPETDIDPNLLQIRIDNLHERIGTIDASYRHVRLASSMAAEDMVLIDAIAAVQARISVFTLDTRRLHSQTIDMIDVVKARYGMHVERVQPDLTRIALLVRDYGENGFYDSLEAKEQCCHVRKVLPLAQALSHADAWVTGQRSEQGETRTALPWRERDAARGIEKFNPLHDWSETEVWAYLRTRSVPVNPLHAAGYPSIGCEPCTRPIQMGEGVRAGRWWWLQEQRKECGLHRK